MRPRTYNMRQTRVLNVNKKCSPFFFITEVIYGWSLSDYEDWQYSTNELDGCYHVFIDVGSNIGNTVRNVFFSDLILDH